MQDKNTARLCIMQYFCFVSFFLENTVANMQDNLSVKKNNLKFELFYAHFIKFYDCTLYDILGLVQFVKTTLPVSQCLLFTAASKF